MRPDCRSKGRSSARRLWKRPAAGWIPTLPAGSRILLRRCILWARIFSGRRGSFCCRSPDGQTTTYGALAGELARQRGLTHFSAQAVGGAVGHNRVSIIIPCHRVVGSGGSLTGYAGGLENKIKLLELESADLRRSVPGRPKERRCKACSPA